MQRFKTLLIIGFVFAVLFGAPAGAAPPIYETPSDIQPDHTMQSAARAPINGTDLCVNVGGDEFLNTATSPANLYFCSATNTWLPVGSPGTADNTHQAAARAPVNGSDLCANVGLDRWTDTSTNEEHYCSATNTWVKYVGGGGGGTVDSIQGDGDVATTGSVLSIDGGTGITTAVVGDVLTVTGHIATPDEVGAVALTEVCQGDGSSVQCDIATLANLNTALGSTVADGVHFTPDPDPINDHGNYLAGHGDGGDCGPGFYAQGVNATGGATPCVQASTEIDSIVGDHQALPSDHHAATPDQVGAVTNTVMCQGDGSQVQCDVATLGNLNTALGSSISDGSHTTDTTCSDAACTVGVDDTITLEGGTTLTAILDDELLVGSAGGGAAAYVLLPDCDGAGEALQYDVALNAWACLTGLGAGGTVDSIQGDGDTPTTGSVLSIDGGTGITTAVVGDILTVTGHVATPDQVGAVTNTVMCQGDGSVVQCDVATLANLNTALGSSVADGAHATDTTCSDSACTVGTDDTIAIEGGTTLTAILDDEVMVGSTGGTAAEYKLLPDCNAAGEALQYDQATNAWDCLTGLGAGGTVDSVQGDGDVATTGSTLSIDGGTGITTAVVGDILTVTGHVATADEVGAVTNTDLCQGDGSQVQCDVATLANLNTALGSTVADGAHATDTTCSDSACTVGTDDTIAIEGGTTLTAIVDDEVLVGSGVGAASYKLLPDCDGAGEALQYDNALNAWACLTGLGAGGTVDSVQGDGDIPTTGSTLSIDGGTGVTTAVVGDVLTVTGHVATPDQVGAVTTTDVCQGDGSQVQCDIATLENLNTALGSTVADGAHIPDVNCTDDACTVGIDDTITLEGGTTLTAVLDDEVIVGSGAGAVAYKLLPDCDGAGEALQYDQALNAWACLTGLGAGGTVDSIQGDGDVATTGSVLSVDGGAGITTAVVGDVLTVDPDVTPSAGEATLIVEEDAVQVKYNAAYFGEDATNGLTLEFTEKAANAGTGPGEGEIWLRNDTPNTFMITGDDGLDHEISTAHPTYIDVMAYDGACTGCGLNGADVVVDGALDIGDRIEEAITACQTFGNIKAGCVLELPEGLHTIDSTIIPWGEEGDLINNSGIWGVRIRGAGGVYVQSGTVGKCGTSIEWDGTDTNATMFTLHSVRYGGISDLCIVTDHDGDGVRPAQKAVVFTAENAAAEVSIGAYMERFGIGCLGDTRVIDDGYGFTTTGIELSPKGAGAEESLNAQIDGFRARDGRIACHTGIQLSQGNSGGVQIENVLMRYAYQGVWIEDSDAHITGGYMNTWPTGDQANSTAEEIANRNQCDNLRGAVVIGNTSIVAGEQPPMVKIDYANIEGDCGNGILTLQGASNVRDSSTTIIGTAINLGTVNGDKALIDYRHDGMLTILGSFVGLRTGFGAIAHDIDLVPPTDLLYTIDALNYDSASVATVTIGANAELAYAHESPTWTGAHDFTGATVDLDATIAKTLTIDADYVDTPTEPADGAGWAIKSGDDTADVSFTWDASLDSMVLDVDGDGIAEMLTGSSDASPFGNAPGPPIYYVSDNNDDGVIDEVDIQATIDKIPPQKGGVVQLPCSREITVSNTIDIDGHSGMVIQGCSSGYDSGGHNSGTVLSWDGVNSGTMVEVSSTAATTRQLFFRDFTLDCDDAHDDVGGDSSADVGFYLNETTSPISGVFFDRVSVFRCDGPAVKIDEGTSTEQIDNVRMRAVKFGTGTGPVNKCVESNTTNALLTSLTDSSCVYDVIGIDIIAGQIRIESTELLGKGSATAAVSFGVNMRGVSTLDGVFIEGSGDGVVSSGSTPTALQPVVIRDSSILLDTLGDEAIRWNHGGTLVIENTRMNCLKAPCTEIDITIDPGNTANLKLVWTSNTLNSLGTVLIDYEDITNGDVIPETLGIQNATDCTDSKINTYLQGTLCYEVSSNKVFGCEPSDNDFCNAVGEWPALAGGGGTVDSVQGDGDVLTSGSAVSIDGGTGITTAVVGDVLTVTGHTATPDEVGAVTNTDLCQGDGSQVQCDVATLANLNTALGSTVADGAHIPDTTCSDAACTVGTDDTITVEGGTTLTAMLDDELLVGTGPAAGAYSALPQCDAAGEALNFNQTGNAFTCRTGLDAGGIVASVQGDGDVLTSGAAVSIDGGTGITTAVVGDVLTVTGHTATPDQVGAVTSTVMCQGDGSQVQCDVATLANLNTALGSTVADGAHITDEVGAVTNTDLCQGDGSQVQCDVSTLANLNTALGSGIVTGAHIPNTTCSDSACTVSTDDTVTLEGGTVITAMLDNEVLVGTGPAAGAYSAVPQCDAAGEALNFNETGNAFTCRTGLDATGGIVASVQGDGDVLTSGAAVSIDGGVGITTAVVGDVLTITGHTATPDEVGAVTLTDLCQGDGSQVQCDVATLANLNTALGSTVADGAHITDEVGATTLDNYCQGDGSNVVCSTSSIPTSDITDLSGVNSGDVSTTGVALSLVGQVIEIDIQPTTADPTLVEADNALSVKYDANVFGEGVAGLLCDDAGSDGTSKGCAAFNSTRFSGTGVIDIASVAGIAGANEDDLTNNNLSDLSDVTGSTGTGTVVRSADPAITVSLNIPNGTGPTLNDDGEIAVDTTGAGTGTGLDGSQFLYYDGTAPAALSTVHQECKVIEDLVVTDDGLPFFMNTAYTDVTLISAACVCVGANCTTEADISFDIDETGTATEVPVTGTVTCEDGDGTSEANTTLSGNTNLDQYDVLTFDVDSSTITADGNYILCVNYRPVVQ